MKKSYSQLLVLLAVVSAFFSGTPAVFAQQTVTLSAAQRAPGDQYAYFDISVVNPGSSPLILGTSTVVFQVQSFGTPNPPFTLTDYSWDNSNSVFTAALGYTFDPTTTLDAAGIATIQLNLSGSGYSIDAGATAKLGTLKVKVADCNAATNQSFDEANSLLSDDGGNQLTLTPTTTNPSVFYPRVTITPTPTLLVSPVYLINGLQQFRFCEMNPITLTVKGDTTAGSYTFGYAENYNGFGQVPVDSIFNTSGPQLSNTYTTLTNPVRWSVVQGLKQGKHYHFFARFNVPGCTYQINSNDFILDSVAKKPVLIAPAADTVNLCRSNLGNPLLGQPKFQVNITPANGILDWKWNVIDERGDSIGRATFTSVNPTSHNSATIIFNPALGTLGVAPYYARARVIVRGVNSCGPGDPLVLHVHIYDSVPHKPNRIVPLRSSLQQPFCVTDTTAFKWVVPDSTIFGEGYKWFVTPDSAVRMINPTANTGYALAPGFPGDTGVSAPPYNHCSAYYKDSLNAANYPRLAGTVPVSDTATIYWNRNYQGNSAVIKVIAKNGCGTGDTARLTVNFKHLPGRPDMVRIISPTSSQDTICGGRFKKPVFADSSVFVANHLVGGGPARDTARYYWFITPATSPAQIDRHTGLTTGALNTFYAGTEGLPATRGSGAPPLITAQAGKMLQGIHHGDTLKAFWNPEFYGWVNVQVAAVSADTMCNFGTPYYYYSTAPNPVYSGFGLTAGAASGPMSRGPGSRLGPLSKPYRIFIRPKPLKCAKPVGPKSWIRNVNGVDTTFSTYGNANRRYYTLTTDQITKSVQCPAASITTTGKNTGSRYATKHVWFMRDDSGHVVGNSLTPQPSDVVTFLPDDFNPPRVDDEVLVNGRSRHIDSCGRSVQLNWKSNARMTSYRIYVYGINDCGSGDTSEGARILLTDKKPGNAVAIRAGNVRKPSPSDDTLSLCKGPGCITYRTSAANTFEFIWRVDVLSNDCGGTVSATGGPLVTVSPDTSADKEADLTDSSIVVCYSPDFCGTVKITARPINAGSNTTVPPLDTVLAANNTLIHVFSNPVSFTGLKNNPPVLPTGDTLVVPVNTPVVLGGAPLVYTPFSFSHQLTGATAALVANQHIIPPTANLGTPFPDPLKYSFSWRSSSGDIANLSPAVSPSPARNSANETFTSQTPGVFTYSLNVLDKSYCGNKNTDTSVSIKVIDSWNIKVDKLFLQLALDTSTGLMNNARQAINYFAGPLQANFERVAIKDSLTAVLKSMNPKLKMTPGYYITNQVVDLITFELRNDSVNKTATAYGYGWLQRDGSVLDFETNTIPTVRFYFPAGDNRLTDQAQYFVTARHSNHLPLMTKYKVKVQQGKNFSATDQVSVSANTFDNGVVTFSDSNYLYHQLKSFYPAKYVGAANTTLTPGNKVFAMISGDVYADPATREINSDDYIAFINHYFSVDHSVFVYDEADLNLDGIVDLTNDLGNLNKACGKIYFSTVP